MRLRRIVITGTAAAIALLLIGCAGYDVDYSNQKSAKDDKQTGSLSFNLWAVPDDVRFIKLTVDSTPVYTKMMEAWGGNLSGAYAEGIPTGSDMTYRLEAYPDDAGPDADVVIFKYEGSGLEIQPGATATITGITLQQIVGLTPVYAEFQEFDPYVVNVVKTQVRFAGLRVDPTRDFYLDGPKGTTTLYCDSMDGSADTQILVPVGSNRVLRVYTFDAAGTILHVGLSGTPFTVTESSTPTVSVTLIPISTPPKILLPPQANVYMGCVTQDTNCTTYENPRHEVAFGEQIYMQRHTVTQAEFVAVMGYLPAETTTSCGPNCPVNGASWIEASNYCGRIGMRLPTEAEWEAAARGTSDYIYICGDDPLCLDSVVWYSGNSSDAMHEVEQKSSNEYGLYDMTGNVMEWVADCWHEDFTDAPIDGQEIWKGRNCHQRVVRGGLYSFPDPRLSYRFWGLSEEHHVEYGFRCAKTKPLAK